jgi:hypothetical protein
MAEHFNIENMASPLVLAAASQAFAALSAETDDPARALWNERLAEYLRRRALYDAESAFGPFRAAQDAHDAVIQSLEARFGKSYRSKEGAKNELAASWAALTAADELNTRSFLEPLWNAARTLTLTPAPDLAAAIIKADIINREESWNDVDLDADAMDLVAADFGFDRKAVQ